MTQIKRWDTEEVIHEFEGDIRETILDAIKQCVSFYRVDLSYYDLSNLDLSKNNFLDAECVATNFTNSNLSWCNFENANLVGTDYSGAELGGANFANSTIKNVKFKLSIFNKETNFSRVKYVY